MTTYSALWAPHQGAVWYPVQKRNVLMLRLVKIPSSYGLLLVRPWSLHLDVQEIYYKDEETQVQARADRQRRVHIAIVRDGQMVVELAGELMDFYSQGRWQHLRDNVLVMLVYGGSELLPAMDVDFRERAMRTLQAQGVD
ncbi:hypothetical protein ACHAW6_000527, partial [Cyclotella cf. meneghiniana]